MRPSTWSIGIRVGARRRADHPYSGSEFGGVPSHFSPATPAGHCFSTDHCVHRVRDPEAVRDLNFGFMGLGSGSPAVRTGYVELQQLGLGPGGI